MKKLLSVLMVFCLIMPAWGTAETTHTLAVAGFIDYTRHSRFVELHPDIAVTVCEDYFQDANRMIDALATQDATYDVMILSTQAIDFKAMMRKGYAYPLSGSSVLENAVLEMYPGLQEWAIYQNKLYALPIGLTCNGLTFHPEYFHETGIEIPETWQDISNIINSWDNQPDEIRENYTISQWTYQYRRWFLQQMMQSFDVYCQAHASEMQFDDPIFLRLMEIADGISTSSDVDETNETAIAALDDTFSLFQNGEDPLQNGFHSSQPIFAASVNGEKYYGAYVTLGIINPYSQHIEEAIKYLEYLAQSTSPQVRLTLYPQGNLPVENTEYAALKAEWQAEEDRLQKAIADSPDEHKRELQDELAAHQSALKWIERARFDVSDEDIAEYLTMASGMVYLGPSLLSMKDSSGKYVIHELQERFLTNTISREQFIKELANKARMIQLEGL